MMATPRRQQASVRDDIVRAAENTQPDPRRPRVSDIPRLPKDKTRQKAYSDFLRWMRAAPKPRGGGRAMEPDMMERQRMEEFRARVEEGQRRFGLSQEEANAIINNYYVVDPD